MQLSVSRLPKEDFRREDEETDHVEAQSLLGLSVCLLEITNGFDSKEKKISFKDSTNALFSIMDT